jgi:uncharacterized protein (DUF433 family)
MERIGGQFNPFDFALGEHGPYEPHSGTENRFTQFSGALARQLAPRNLLEHVLAGRIILSAWTMQMIAEKEIDAIKNPRVQGRFDELLGGQRAAQGDSDVDVSPQSIALVADCLETTLELFHRLRATAPVDANRPAPAATDASLDLDADSDFDPDSDSGPDTVFDVDSELVEDHLADFSNEWPVVPRGRSVEDQPDGDTGDREPSDQREEPLGGRWEGRLAWDPSVSEDSPVIKGTWVTVSQVVSLIVDGWAWSDILRTHPELSEDDIRTSLAYTVAEEEGSL